MGCKIFEQINLLNYIYINYIYNNYVNYVIF